MKKIFAMAVSLIAAVSVQAQDLTDNYQKVYAGFTTYNLDEKAYSIKDNTATGFQIGYAYAFNITGHNIPLFIEAGAEFNYVSSSKWAVDMEKYGGKDVVVDASISGSNIAIPINVTYKFGNEDFTVAPFIGEAIRIWTSMKMKGEADGECETINLFDNDDMKLLTYDMVDTSFNRFQMAFNVGVNFTIKQHYQIGYRFQASTISVEPKYTIGDETVFNEASDTAHSITFSYVF